MWQNDCYVGGMAYSILIVHPHPTELAEIADPLQNCGYRVSRAATFEEAKTLLEADPPTLLIAATRLGAFNGLHLVVRGRCSHPEMAAIVTDRIADPMLRAEAVKQGATYVSEQAPGELLSLVAGTLASRPM
jgi:DNA-binding response OmpR family regulator